MLLRRPAAVAVDGHLSGTPCSPPEKLTFGGQLKIKTRGLRRSNELKLQNNAASPGASSPSLVPPRELANVLGLGRARTEGVPVLPAPGRSLSPSQRAGATPTAGACLAGSYAPRSPRIGLG